jgi:hypothetical protein
VSARLVRLVRARLQRAAQLHIAQHGPPEPPWRKFPNLPGASSGDWRQGMSGAYLDFTFDPWWRTLSDNEKVAYLDAHAAPADGRWLLQRKRCTTPFLPASPCRGWRRARAQAAAGTVMWDPSSLARRAHRRSCLLVPGAPRGEGARTERGDEDERAVTHQLQALTLGESPYLQAPA